MLNVNALMDLGLLNEQNTPNGSNADLIKRLSRNTEKPRKIAELDAMKQGWDDTIKKGGVVFDVGCNDGETGVYLAAKWGCSLIQGDINNDFRFNNLKSVPFVHLPDKQIPLFDGGTKADTVLMVDVLHHVNYSGSSLEDDRIMFLRGYSTALAEGGKIVVITTHPTGEAIYEDNFQNMVKNDDELKGKVEFVDFKTKKRNPAEFGLVLGE